MQANTDAITLDVRGLPPPEPLENIVTALGTLGAGKKLRVLIDREPFPLYEILTENRFLYSSTANENGGYEVLIWPEM